MSQSPPSTPSWLPLSQRLPLASSIEIVSSKCDGLRLRSMSSVLPLLSGDVFGLFAVSGTLCRDSCLNEFAPPAAFFSRFSSGLSSLSVIGVFSVVPLTSRMSHVADVGGCATLSVARARTEVPRQNATVRTVICPPQYPQASPRSPWCDRLRLRDRAPSSCHPACRATRPAAACGT